MCEERIILSFQLSNLGNTLNFGMVSHIHFLAEKANGSQLRLGINRV